MKIFVLSVFFLLLSGVPLAFAHDEPPLVIEINDSGYSTTTATLELGQEVIFSNKTSAKRYLTFSAPKDRGTFSGFLKVALLPQQTYTLSYKQEGFISWNDITDNTTITGTLIVVKEKDVPIFTPFEYQGVVTAPITPWRLFLVYFSDYFPNFLYKQLSYVTVQTLIRDTFTLYSPDAADLKVNLIFKNNPYSIKAHSIMHLIGREYFLKYGMDGIAKCSFNFMNGCYHGFIEEASATKGDNFYITVNELCEKHGFRLCKAISHGIGHALYSKDQNVLLDIQECSKVKYPHTCVGGIFMEYNLNLDFDLPKDKIVGYDCSTLTGYPRAVCFGQTAGLIFRILREKDGYSILPNGFKGVVKACSAIPLKEDRLNCFYGIGSSMALQAFKKHDEAQAACNSLKDAEEKKYCTTGHRQIYDFFKNTSTTTSGKVE